MTFQELITKYTDKKVEVAGSPGAVNQCVDLANLYIRDVLGLPIIEWTNAVDFPSKAGSSYEYILNTPNGVPQNGDIIIWGKPYGKYISEGKTIYAGHIAIFIEGDVKKFTSFDQNEPVGSPCHIQSHTYTGVLGWLRCKKPITQQSQIDALRVERDTNWNLYTASQKENETLRNQLQNLNRDYEGVTQELSSFKAIIRTYATLLNVGETETERISGEIKRLIGYEDQHNELSKTADQLLKEVSILQNENTSLHSEIDRFTGELRDTRTALEVCQTTKSKKTLNEFSKLERLLSIFM